MCEAEPGWAAVPIGLQRVGQGCRCTGWSASDQVAMAPLPAPCSPTLTDIPPVVGVPRTLVVSKAQLNLHAVDRWKTQESLVTVGPSYLGPGSHPSLPGKGKRALQGKSRGKTGESIVPLALSLPTFTGAIENTVRGYQWGT